MICYLSKWGVKCLSIFTLLFNVAALTETHERSYYEQRGEILWEVPVQKKVIALTFDDGPHKEISPQILDLLKQYDAKATFFVLGNRMDKYKEIILREVAEGHELGNHTFNHALFNKKVSKGELNREIELTKQKLYEITGTYGKWFRPPGGYYNDDVVAAAKENGYTVVMWSWHQDTEDWKRPGAKKIARKVLNNVRNGDIVLMHDNVRGSTQTLEALKIILPELTARGYKFVTVSQLMQKKIDEELDSLADIE